jgi:hypothetical protein
MATASQSLFNMSVGADNTPSTAALLMPKLQFRFRALFLNFGVGGATQELTRQVIDITRPQLTFTEIPIDIYNSKMYLAGKHDWAATTLNLRDDATGKVASLVGQQIQKQMDFVEQASAATGQDYKFQLNYEVLDGGNGTATPTVLETWELYGCFIQSVNYNNMSYSESNAATIQLVVRYDNAISSPLSSGIGVAVGRALGGTTITGIGRGTAA